jgi:hypothetical protein
MMMKKNLLVCLLLFFYTVVLAHNTVPHGHFDELFSAEHESDSHDHSDHSSHDHHFAFSHSISLHVTIEKQLTFSAYQSKAAPKNIPGIVSYCIITDLQDYSPPDYYWTPVYCTPKSQTPTCSNTDFNRGPPLS